MKTIIFLLLPLALHADTTIDATRSHAHGANIGWIEMRGNGTVGAVVGEFTCAGWIHAANVGWISLGDGAPANGIRYQNDDAADFGVNTRDYTSGDGRAQAKLRGLAYGANVGWIRFEETGDPRVDLRTGELLGHAYGANIGWIALGGNGVTVRTTSIARGADSDGDGMPDAWEFQRAGNLSQLTAASDRDGDGVPDREEYAADTDPLGADDRPRITSFQPPRQIDENGPLLTSLEWTSKATRQYSIEISPDLTGTWISVLGQISPDAGLSTSRTFSDTGATRGFYRIRAELPLAR